MNWVIRSLEKYSEGGGGVSRILEKTIYILLLKPSHRKDRHYYYLKALS